MKNYFKKSVGVLLILLTLLSTLTGCYKDEGYISGNLSVRFEFAPNHYAKVTSDKSIFDKGDVTLDFSYSLYPLDGASTLETQKLQHFYIPSESEREKGEYHREAVFAIYISNDQKLIFEEDEQGYLLDYENKVNGKLWKFISFEEAFTTDYGYTTSGFKINYHHSEKITIPAEFFKESNEWVNIYILMFWRNVDKGDFYQCYSGQLDKPTVEIRYRLTGNKIKLRIN